MSNDIEKTAANYLVRMSDIEPKAVKWLWPLWIPQGKITMLRGNGGTGKTSFALKLASIVSNGGGLPMLQGNHGDHNNHDYSYHNVKPGNVLFISAEDDLADTIAPRLISYGANMDRVFAYRESTEQKLQYTSELFEQLIWEAQPSLILVDPVQGFFGGADMNRANHVRPIMTHLRILAEKYNCAMVLIEHLTKSGRGGGFHRGLGSIDITSAARSVLMLGNDPNNSEERGVCQIKGNLGYMPGVIGFSITDEGFDWNPDTYLTPDIIEGRHNKKDLMHVMSALEDAKDFLCDILSEGAQLCADVELEARQSGISQKTLRRAREALKVVVIRQGFGTPASWVLPNTISPKDNQNT